MLTCYSWTNTYFITHGRDNKIYVWQLEFDTKKDLDIFLPVDHKKEGYVKPWMLYSINVHSLNYCSFATCDKEHQINNDIFIAVPSSIKTELVDIYDLPNCQLVHSGIGSTKETTGIVMSLCLYYRQELSFKILEISVGFESGHVGVFAFSLNSQSWEIRYLFKIHTEPVISIHCDASHEFLISSGADSFIVKYMLNSCSNDDILTFKTHHIGQQSLRIRSDAKIFATAGWDGRVRVYSCRTLSQLAVCKLHEIGCCAIAFGEVISKYSEIMELFGRNRYSERLKKHWLAAGGKDGKVSLWEIY